MSDEDTIVDPVVQVLEDQIAGLEEHVLELEDLLRRWKKRHADLREVVTNMHCDNCGFRPWVGPPAPEDDLDE